LTKTTGLFYEDVCIQPSCVNLSLMNYDSEAPMQLIVAMKSQHPRRLSPIS